MREVGFIYIYDYSYKICDYFYDERGLTVYENEFAL